MFWNKDKVKEKILEEAKKENEKLMFFYTHTCSLIKKTAMENDLEYNIGTELRFKQTTEGYPRMTLFNISTNYVTYDKATLYNSEHRTLDGTILFKFYTHGKEFDIDGIIWYHKSMEPDIVEKIVEDYAEELCRFVAMERLKKKEKTKAIVAIGFFKAMLDDVPTAAIKRGSYDVFIPIPRNHSVVKTMSENIEPFKYQKYNCNFMGCDYINKEYIPIFRYEG